MKHMDNFAVSLFTVKLATLRLHSDGWQENNELEWIWK